ncbi:MAG: hypothetical protein U0401_33920 [Anaerolineae bacterium]
MTLFIRWLRLNWSLLAVLAGVGLAFFLLKNDPTPGLDSLQALDRAVASGQPTVIEFYSNF